MIINHFKIRNTRIEENEMIKNYLLKLIDKIYLNKGYKKLKNLDNKNNDTTKIRRIRFSTFKIFYTWIFKTREYSIYK